MAAVLPQKWYGEDTLTRISNTPQTAIRCGGDCNIDEVGPYDAESIERSRRGWGGQEKRDCNRIV
jgi:hypothetical protein